MSKILVIFTFILMDKIHESHEIQPPQTTMHILDRVKVLKYQINERLKKSQGVRPDPKNLEKPMVDENLDYVNPNRPITPILSKDPRKKKPFKLSVIRTTPAFKESKALRDIHRGKDFEQHVIVPKKRKSKQPARSQITDLFYRRMHASNIVNPWLHCNDLLTPFLNGHKVNMTRAKRITFTDNVVVRLAQLLTEDLTDHSRDDIASILYQISNLNIRLFQWDINAIKLIFNVINPTDSGHNFKALKFGVKKIFKTWNLSFEADLNALLKHTTVFRPPCMLITHNEGSTKSSKGVRYTKTKPPKKPCTGDGQIQEDGKLCVGTWIDK